MFKMHLKMGKIKWKKQKKDTGRPGILMPKHKLYKVKIVSKMPTNNKI